jgi:hypothetical protein
MNMTFAKIPDEEDLFTRRNEPRTAHLRSFEYLHCNWYINDVVFGTLTPLRGKPHIIKPNRPRIHSLPRGKELDTSDRPCLTV